MSDIAANLTQLVGKTPVLSLSRYCAEVGARAGIIAKLEYFNPLGSAKDRVGLAMIEDAEKQGLLKKSSVVIEPTSGNTGVGLAFACSIKGYRLILTMPENMSEERKKLLSALGAELVLTPASEGMAGAIEKSKALAQTIPDAYIPDQFSNPSNPQIHRITTGPELLRDTNGKINYFVAGVGTGGTITGVGEILKAFNKRIKIVAVEPADSPVLSGGQAGPNKIMGIGAGFVPDNLNRGILDEVITVTTEQAYECARLVAKKEGLLVGISSGAALYAATQIAKRPEAEGKTVAVLFTDSGERYLSTNLFEI